MVNGLVVSLKYLYTAVPLFILESSSSIKYENANVQHQLHNLHFLSFQKRY